MYNGIRNEFEKLFYSDFAVADRTGINSKNTKGHSSLFEECPFYSELEAKSQ